MNRAAQIADFLTAAGWGAAALVPLAGDASARRYFRLQGGAILMDVPPQSGLTARPFLAVTDWLRAAGFSAPEVIAADLETGLVLLEDLGDGLFARICAETPALEAPLYTAAVDLMIAIQSLPPPSGAWAPAPYDCAFLIREALLLPEWYLGGAPSTRSDELAELIGTLAMPVLAAPPVPVLRDYHAENLIWLPERRGLARVGVLDYQDMLAGHPAYDLVSLLSDARRDIDPTLRTTLIERYLAATNRDREDFLYAAHFLSAQRNLKILGLFMRLARRDAKPGYLRHLPRVWGHLQRDLGHPDLTPLRAWVAAHVPPPDAADLRAML